jgi:hypothetical protein
MRRQARRNQRDVLQRKLSQRAACDRQVTQVRRVERPPENAK